MSDVTEPIRRKMVAEINAVEGSREYLESKHGEIWETTQLQENFEVIGFMAPFVGVRRRCDGVRGSVMFQARQRFYFRYQTE